jgi:aromatic-L-amino-acid decarboxylase
MKWAEFRHWGEKAARWAAEYHANLRNLPVRPKSKPGDILSALPASPPESAQPMDTIFADFENIIMPGMTHWQHPRFFAYFPANAAPVSVFAEFLVSSVAAQCMLWQTSPAATELETRVIDWMRQAIGLPSSFSGVIQDSASSATLCAVLTMREKALEWLGNKSGLTGEKELRIYASREVHSSIDRAIWISGIGENNLVRIESHGPQRAMNPAALNAAIESDLADGMIPAGIITCIGGTSAGASDDLVVINAIAKKHNLFVHVDAAWAGSAMICPEYRELWKGVEDADSVVFNPHKWLGAQFDCSTHFIKDPAALVRTLAIQPEYLKTHGQDGIINYSEWSVPLGRRFRALKLWFLIRAHGLEGLRDMIRNHVNWSQDLAMRLEKEPDFEIVTKPYLSLFTFRYLPKNCVDPDLLNLELINTINDDGRIYLTQTIIDKKRVIRFQAGAFTMEKADGDAAFEVITGIAAQTDFQTRMK